MANSVNYIEVLKALRDETHREAPTYSNWDGEIVPARTPAQIEALTAVIEMLSGESAEADWQIYYETEMDTVITYIVIRGADIVVYDKNWDDDDLDPHERMKVAEQIVSGALALRAVLKLTQERDAATKRVSELENALNEAATSIRGAATRMLLDHNDGKMANQLDEDANSAYAALRGEETNNG